MGKVYKKAIIIILASFFLTRIVQIARFFHGEIPGIDYAVHGAKVVFLARYGFHGMVPNWYNGFQLFSNYPPLYYYFNYIFFLLVNDIFASMAITIFAILVMGGLFFKELGKEMNLKNSDTLLFYLLFYINPIANFSFFYNGRITELLAWTLFVGLFVLIIKLLKEVKVKYLIGTTAFIAAITLSHPSVMIFSLVIFSGLLFIHQKTRERIKLAISMLAAFVITSFWWPTMLLTKANIARSIQDVILFGEKFHPLIILRDRLMFFGFAAVFLAIFYIIKRKGMDWRFFVPVAVLSVLNITMITAFVPLLNVPLPLSYQTFYIFLFAFVWFKDRRILKELSGHFEKYPKTIKIFTKFVVRICVIIVLISYIIHPVMVYFPYQDNTYAELFEIIDDRFIATKFSDDFQIYGYGAAKYDLHTPFGWFPEKESQELKELRYELYGIMSKKDCARLKSVMQELEAPYIVTDGRESCVMLRECELEEIKSVKELCLYKASKKS